MAKQLLYTDEARKKLLAGAEKLSKAVGSTLGPTGRNVIIEKSFGGPTVTKDGVTVSKEIDLPDPFENMGAKLVNAVAQKTSDIAGDGTTTATILAWSPIYQEGLRNITSGANPMLVKRGIDLAVDATVEFIEKKLRHAFPPWDKGGEAMLTNVASKCRRANNDEVIGKMMWPRRSRRSARTASSLSRKAKPPRRCSSSSKGCSSTKATSARTSSPMRRR